METDKRVMPYPIRLMPDLRDYLQKCADAGYRTLHSEIIRRLEESRKQEEIKQ